MIFDVSIITLLLYCAQQLGVALGLGAQTIMLVAYINSMRDGVIDATEERFLRATRNTLWVSLGLIAVSGITITALHVLAGQGLTILTPAYLFKLLLIVVVILLTALLHTLPETFAEGLLGGTWYALFVVHILAPVTTWSNLLLLWAVWMVGFTIVWYVLVFSTHESKEKDKKIAVLKPEPIKISEPPIVKKPHFSFFKHAKEEPLTTEPIIAPALVQSPPALVLAKPVEPQQFQPIKLDPAPISQPIAVVEPKPIPPVAPTTHARPITLAVERLPAGLTTDTPFLPQVPPLQPIPTIPPTPSAVPQANPAVPAASNVSSGGVSTTPIIAPEFKAGLNVMPKSPGDINQSLT